MKTVIPFFIAACLFAATAAGQATRPGSHPTPWTEPAPGDILWRKTVEREINLRQPGNAVFGGDPAIPRNSVFPLLLLYGALQNRYPAFSPSDKDLRQPLTSKDLRSIAGGNPEDTLGFSSAAYPARIRKIRIIELWMFDKKGGQMIVRINAMAPVQETILESGDTVYNPVFWIRYLDARYFFAENDLITQAPRIKGMNWDEYFESREFSSVITRVEGAVTEEIPGKKRGRKKKGSDPGGKEFWVY